MTGIEYRLKYPIGAEIRYTPIEDVNRDACKDIGNQGTVVEHDGNRVRIYLPTSAKWSKTWRTQWKNITPVIKKNQQLLFSFMD